MDIIQTMLVGARIALGVILTRGPIVQEEPPEMGHIHHHNFSLVSHLPLKTHLEKFKIFSSRIEEEESF
jgi:hypothetical protein